MAKEYPYKMGWRPQLKDLRDYKFTATPEQVAVLPAYADIRAQDTPILQQGGIGSCTAHAGVGIFMYLQQKRLGTYTMGSRLYIYYRTRHDIEGVDGDVGATLRDTAKEMAKFGVPPETDWPYNEDKYDVEPPAKAGVNAKKFVSTNYYLCDGSTPAATINNIKTAVALVGLPVMFGTTVYEQIMDVGQNGMIAQPGGKVAGGHAMDIMGYDNDRQAFLIKNSWGEGWGMNGYGWLPYSYFTKELANDSWVIAAESELDNPVPPTPPEPEASFCKLREIVGRLWENIRNFFN
jgi:C1A family cysteine protease